MARRTRRFLLSCLLLSVLFCENGLFCRGNLIANLNSRSQDQESPLKLISYCIDCPSPEQEGTIIQGLLPRYGLKTYFVSAELIYCIPNKADSGILNDHQFHERIVLVDRGDNSLLDKVISIQNGGAAGVLIADDGQCNEDFSYCGPRAGSVKDGGFAAHDYMSESWRKISIPVLLITFKSAETIRRLMPVKRVLLPRLGYHNITVLRNPDGSADEL